MSARKVGQRVVIASEGGMPEFRGKTGMIVDNTDRDGHRTMYRVLLDVPVTVPGVGVVTDDLWAGEYLKAARGAS